MDYHNLKKENVFTNRISYDVINDAYYENGKKYIEFWDRGALYYENLIYATHYSGDRTYLRDTTALIPENFKLSASIIYKFDYSSYETLSITSLNLKLNCYDNNTGYQLIISISTNHHTDNKLSSSSPNHYLKSLKWNIIKETYIKNTNERMNLPKNLTRFMTKNNKIFYIKAEIIKKDHKNYQKNLQLFPYIKNHFDEFSIKKNFGLDVRVELSSSLIVPSYNISYEKCMIKSEGCDGLFNDKYKFNVLPVENMKNIYTHRISYNVVTNAYYENGKTDIKYLKRWDRGTLTNKNIYYSLENSADLEIDYISRNLSVDKKNQSAYVTWKFDYRPGNFYINSLKLRLKFHYSSQRSKIQWSIKLLPTRKNPNSEFKPINFPFQENNLDYIIDLTDIAKDEYGFILKAKMIGGKTQLFRQDVNKNEKSLLHLNDDNFDMDVEAKLKPNMICDEYNTSVNEKNFLFNDKNTSDFVIKLELEKNNDNMDLENFFYLHSKILTSISDYFKALFNSQMIESHNRFLKLYDIPLNIFENLLSFIYDDNLKNLKNLDDWVDLLYISSRFLIPKLVQICELSIREYVNFDNVEEIRLIARECNAEQLFKYCEMYKI
ncbi:BTB/POZ protein [Rhizophagus clarus]|uniref:BTB/POZ protein n=1 Tax=Rhizophagus clarus TaxID=94130 RepID=A0A8H3L3F8_9GLOM|nr:BTB/POZ protein [Rhizophagus clarus]